MRGWLLILFLLLVSSARAEPLPDRVQIKIVTDPPGAQVIPDRRGATAGQRTVVGLTNGPPLAISVPAEQQTLTLELEHWLCRPSTVTIELAPYRANLRDTYPDNGVLQLEYRSWAHALLGHLQPWLAALLALVGVASVLYLRQWRSAELVRRQAELDTARAGEILQRIVPAAGDPMVGALLDGYRLVERLGQGGMARVYLGQSDDGRESVAVKILDAELATDDQFIRRFSREKDVYAELKHPNIVRILGFGYYHEHHYLLMELIRGTTLRSCVRPGGMPLSEALQYMRPVFKALAYAHSKSIVHRDLKPENIMVTQDGKVKVMDFGMAGGQGFSVVTTTGSMLGTPAYMAPEQAKGELDPRSDQYALGIMMFELLTGQPPFMDDNPINIVFKHISETAPTLASLRPELEGVSGAVDRMLAKEPVDRYADVTEALQALERALR